MSPEEEWIKNNPRGWCRQNAWITQHACDNRRKVEKKSNSSPHCRDASGSVLMGCERCAGLDFSRVRDNWPEPEKKAFFIKEKNMGKTLKKKEALSAAKTSLVQDQKTIQENTASSNVPVLNAADPRESFECPHCACALSSSEVDQPHCPVCGETLDIRISQSGDAPSLLSLDGRVTNIDGEKVGFGVDPLVNMAIDEALTDLKTSWLIDLSGLTPGRAICETYRKIESLQMLRAA